MINNCQGSLNPLNIKLIFYCHLDQLGKGWPLLRVIVPAVKHHVVNFSVAVLRLLKSDALPDPLHHLENIK